MLYWASEAEICLAKRACRELKRRFMRGGAEAVTAGRPPPNNQSTLLCEDQTHLCVGYLLVPVNPLSFPLSAAAVLGAA